MASPRPVPPSAACAPARRGRSARSAAADAPRRCRRPRSATANRDAVRHRSAAARGRGPASIRTRCCRAAIFDRVVDQVLEDLGSWSSSPTTAGRLSGAVSDKRDPPRRRLQFERVDSAPRDPHGLTRPVGGVCSSSSIRDSDSRSSTSRAIRPACSSMIVEEAVARLAASSRAGPRRVSMNPGSRPAASAIRGWHWRRNRRASAPTV